MEIKNLRKNNPLVLHYTNEVTINDCANITLAIGGSPLMSYSNREAKEIIPLASAVVINIGTMNQERLPLFLEAGKIANRNNKPVVLDPVGCFATNTRLEFTKRLIKEIKFSVIKGNLSEIKAIGGLLGTGKGVDSEEGESDINYLKILSKSLGVVIAVTGKKDIVTDGKIVIEIQNGTEKLKGVTGTGCMTGSLIGAFLGSFENPLNATRMAILSMGIAGEMAAENFKGLGTFKVDLMDNISNLSDEVIEEWRKDKAYEI